MDLTSDENMLFHYYAKQMETLVVEYGKLAQKPKSDLLPTLQRAFISNELGPLPLRLQLPSSQAPLVIKQIVCGNIKPQRNPSIHVLYVKLALQNEQEEGHQAQDEIVVIPLRLGVTLQAVRLLLPFFMRNFVSLLGHRNVKGHEATESFMGTSLTHYADEMKEGGDVGLRPEITPCIEYRAILNRLAKKYNVCNPSEQTEEERRKVRFELHRFMQLDAKQVQREIEATREATRELERPRLQNEIRELELIPRQRAQQAQQGQKRKPGRPPGPSRKTLAKLAKRARCSLDRDADDRVEIEVIDLVEPMAEPLASNVAAVPAVPVGSDEHKDLNKEVFPVQHHMEESAASLQDWLQEMSRKIDEKIEQKIDQSMQQTTVELKSLIMQTIDDKLAAKSKDPPVMDIHTQRLTRVVKDMETQVNQLRLLQQEQDLATSPERLAQLVQAEVQKQVEPFREHYHELEAMALNLTSMIRKGKAVLPQTCRQAMLAM
jgi:predicted RNA-binding protein Jag